MHVLQDVQLHELINNAVLSLEVELYSFSLQNSTRNTTVSIYIDKQGGVGIDDCVAVSRQVQLQLSNHEKYADFHVEVSSPGVERKLHTIDHYKNNIGKLAKVKFSHAEENKTIEGYIISVDGDDIVLSQGDADRICVSFSNIIKSKLIWRHT